MRKNRLTSLQKKTTTHKTYSVLLAFKKFVIPILAIFWISFYFYSTIINADVDILWTFYIEKEQWLWDNKILKSFSEDREKVTTYNPLKSVNIVWTNEAFRIYNWLWNQITWNSILWFDWKDKDFVKRELSYKWIYWTNKQILSFYWKNYKTVLKPIEVIERIPNTSNNFLFVKEWQFWKAIENQKEFDWIVSYYKDLYDIWKLKLQLKNKELIVITDVEWLKKIFYDNDDMFIDWIALIIAEEDSLEMIKDTVSEIKKIISIHNSKDIKITLLSEKNKFIYDFIWDKWIKNAFLKFKD